MIPLIGLGVLVVYFLSALWWADSDSDMGDVQLRATMFFFFLALGGAVELILFVVWVIEKVHHT